MSSTLTWANSGNCTKLGTSAINLLTDLTQAALDPRVGQEIGT